VILLEKPPPGGRAGFRGGKPPDATPKNRRRERGVRGSVLIRKGEKKSHVSRQHGEGGGVASKKEKKKLWLDGQQVKGQNTDIVKMGG